MGATASNKKYGKKVDGTGKRFTDAFSGFVNIDLTEEDRLKIAQAIEEGACDVLEFLKAVLDDGYKFSVSGDPAHYSFIATLTGKAEGCENKGYALSGRGPGAHEAVVCLWYKHAVLAHWGPWTEQGRTNDGQLPLFR